MQPADAQGKQEEQLPRCDKRRTPPLARPPAQAGLGFPVPAQGALPAPQGAGDFGDVEQQFGGVGGSGHNVCSP